MTINTRLIDTFAVGNILGEGVLWRASDATLWWTDIQDKKLFNLVWRSQELRTIETPERVGSFGFIEGRDDLLVVAFESGFAIFRPDDGHMHWLARPAELGDGVRLNDGRVDPFGRFWAGAMIERDLHPGETPDAKLYMLDEKGVAQIRAGGVHIANGLCWSPAGDHVYFSDSMHNAIRIAPFYGDGAGSLAFNQFAKTTNGSPDGAVTDHAGRYWSALWGGSRVVCFAPNGEEVFSLAVDAVQPTCPAFGGPDGNLMFVTSARDGLNKAELAASPNAGALFVYETNVTAPPTARAKFSPTVLDTVM